jgi:hypothetical protein
VPAQAGLVRGSWCRRRCRPVVPCAGGANPVSLLVHTKVTASSPRTRGWSAARPRARPHAVVLPARVGLVPSAGAASLRTPSFSPHARGLSPGHGLRGPPSSLAGGAGPGMARPQQSVSTSSPRRRDWSRDLEVLRRPRRGRPRSRGAGPHLVALQEYGLLSSALRRAGPEAGPAQVQNPESSPRRRRWSPAEPDSARGRAVVLAQAGLVRRSRRPSRLSGRCARTRGARPVPPDPTTACRTSSSHARGWSRVQHVRVVAPRVVPAHAGLILS